MSVWVIIPPFIAYVALVFTAASVPSVGFYAMRWFYAWLAVALAWLWLSHVMEW